MKLSETWNLSNFSNWSIINESSKTPSKKRIDEIRQEGINNKNEEEYWRLIGEFEVVTTTKIKDGDYRIYHRASKLFNKKYNQRVIVPFKEGKNLIEIQYRPYFNLINNSDYKYEKYYADNPIKIRAGNFDIKAILQACDAIIKKSNDWTHVWIEDLELDRFNEIEIISGS